MTASDDVAAPLRPILTTDPLLRSRGVSVAGGQHRFAEVAVRAGGKAAVLPAAAVPALHPQHAPILDRIAASRGALGALLLDRPRVLGVLDMRDDPAGGETASLRVQAMVSAGAEAIEVLLPSVDQCRGLRTACDLVPLVLGGPDRALAVAAGAVAWRPSSPLPAQSGALRPVLALPSGPDDYAAADQMLAAMAMRGVARETVILEVGAGSPAMLGRLPDLHALGVALMLDLTDPGVRGAGPCAEAAAAVLGAGFGVQLLRTTSVAAVSAAVALWRAANGLAP